MKIYVASSWKNKYQPEVVKTLLEAGFEVYDFRNPGKGRTGFSWTKVSEDWQDWTPEQYRQGLEHPEAKAGFKADYEAMLECDACLLVLPCGRSAHTEAGWFCGNGKKTIVLIPEKQEAELMYGLFDAVCCTMEEVLDVLGK